MRLRGFATVAVLLAMACGVIYWGLGLRLPPADLRFGNSSEPQTLDPAKMTGVPEGRIARTLFEGLTYPNLKDLTRPKPGVAMRWEVSPDGKTYTFYLREDARWSNGAEVSADDFLFSWRRLLSPTTASQYAEIIWPILHAKAFNQQLFYVTPRSARLLQSPVRGAPVAAQLPAQAILIRSDLGRKEIRSKEVKLLDPQGKATEARVRSGQLVTVLAKKSEAAALSYLIQGEGGAKGWIRHEHLKQSSKKIEPSKVAWIEVRTMKAPHRSGWIRQASLKTPAYAYPPKAGARSRYRAWEWVGLKVRALQKPLPKGYSPKALGRRLIFEVKLESPTAYFPQLASFYAVTPVYPPLVKKHPRSWVLPKHFVGNGPFRLTHWLINDLVRVEKSPTYWDAKNIHIGSIHFLALTERDTQLSMYLSGDLDIVSNNVPLPTVDKLKGRPDFRSEPYLGSYFYRFNVNQPPLNNKYVRQALAWAIDRESITRYILRSGQTPASAHVPPGIRGYPPLPKVGPGFDPKRAKALLKKAGYDDGSKLPAMSILYNTNQQHKKIAEAIQKMWSQHLGIRVHLVNKEWKTFLDATKKLDYQIARAGWIGDYTDPNTFLSMFITGGGHNRTGWSHSGYDRLIQQAAKETDEAKRFGLFRKAEAILVDELPILPLYYYTYQNLVSLKLKGHVENPLNNFDFRLFRRVP